MIGMKCNAILKTESSDARSVSEALNVDNTALENLEIETREEGGHIVTKLGSDNPHTLLNTLDDLISCQMVAERAITKNG
ncbi:MAG: KEOPS complex subunit Pcc1 [Candidatus Altiarchaeota archaeon]|nr:KEOPS complex subunit Pcc1 [Candidatus Altiarchaeota archaeon]